jgi:hypothetical protein
MTRGSHQGAQTELYLPLEELSLTLQLKEVVMKDMGTNATAMRVAALRALETERDPID